MYLTTVQLTSKLTLACGEHACVLQFLSCLESKHVTRNGLYVSQLSCTAHETFRMLHASNYLGDAQ